MPWTDYLGIDHVDCQTACWWWAAHAGRHLIRTPMVPESIDLWRRLSTGDLAALGELVAVSERDSPTAVEVGYHPEQVILSRPGIHSLSLPPPGTHSSWLRVSWPASSLR